jgi:WD40 repeat protein
VSSKRFLSNPKFKSYVHSQIADYFMGLWANKPKPFSYTEEQKRMFMLKSLHGEADRKVPAQPEIFYNPNDNSIRYNGRKLSELPFHLIRSARIEELYASVLFHYKFLFAKLSCMPLNSLIADYEDYLGSYKYDKEVVLVSDALRLASSILSASASNLVPQIIGRLLPYTYMNQKKFSNVRTLIQECESEGIKDCAFVPAYNCFHVPGGPLVYSLEAHPFAVYGICLMSDATQLLSVSNRFIMFDLSSGDVMRVMNPQIEGIMQSLSASSDRKYCISFTNNDQIVVCNVISGDVKVTNRPSMNAAHATHVTTNATPSASHTPTQQQQHQQHVQSKHTQSLRKDRKESKDQINNSNVAGQHQQQQSQQAAAAAAAASVKEYNDTLLGTYAGLNYFVIWSKYYYYVYDKKSRLVKAEKLACPIIQIEIVENKSVDKYGIELELVSRAEDCRDDEDKDRDHLIVEYVFVLDHVKLPKRSKETKEPSEEDVLKMYMPSSSRIEVHSCLVLTKDKRKLFACTEIGDNIVECYRKKLERSKENGNEVKKNVWSYHGSLDDNVDKIYSLLLSEDESYMLAVVVWGFKVFYLLTGQSKPLKLPAGVKNIQIGYKKLTFPAVFSKENRYVVAGVRDNIHIWDTSYGTYLKTLDAHYGRITCLLGSSKEQKNLVLSSSMDKTIKIWNLNNVMEEDFALDRLEKPVEALHVSILASIAMAQSRNQLAIFSLKDGKIKYQLCHNPHGAIFNCSAMSSTGTFAASSESNRLVIWDIEERKATFVAPPPAPNLHIKQLQFHQAEINVICATLDMTTRVVRLTNYIIPEGEVLYTIEYGLKNSIDYKNFVVTSDDAYLAIFRNDKKTDMLSVYSASDGSHVHNIKLQYMSYMSDIVAIVPMHKNPNLVGLIDSEKGNIINLKEKRFIRSTPKWNGKATKDDKFGLYAPSRGGLELLELKTGNKVKVLIPKVAEGVFDVDTLITENDRHVIYYHSGRRTIRAFRLEDGKKIADYKSTAKVRCMVCAQDSKSVIIGCEDGTVNMLIIADPELNECVSYLREWREEQMKLFSREGKKKLEIFI